MKVALTGASGFVGTALQGIFEECVVLGRYDSHELLVKKLEDVDVVINLAGAPIMKRWNDAYIKELYTSRINTTSKVVKAINKSSIKHFISASAIGIYPNNIACDESSAINEHDILGSIVHAWEEEALKCTKPTSIVRFGIILDQHGGALQQMLTPFKLGIGGPIANGQAMMSWIALTDLLKAIHYIIDKELVGTFNLTAPEVVSNKVFTKTLARVLKRPALIPVPKFMLELLFGRGAKVLTDSKEAYPKKLLDAGFSFTYPNLYQALQSILDAK